MKNQDSLNNSAISEPHGLRVQAVIAAPGFNTDEVLIHAASLERMNAHPLAQAIVEHAKTSQIDLLPAAHIQMVEGKGKLGRVNGKIVLLGNAALMQEGGIDISLLHAEAVQCHRPGCEVIFVSIGDHLAGLISVVSHAPVHTPDWRCQDS